MEIREFVEKYKKNMIDDITEFVAIPSIYDGESATKEKPFGEEVDRGLNWILEKADQLGMKTKNLDGYAGEVTVGEGPFMIGVLAHEDVVAAGEDWETEPFEAIVKDNKIYGRGTSDDKGPLISSLYAMKYLMDEGRIPEGTCLRMIVGTNEEQDWGGIEYYTANVDKLPDYSIVPDGYFPLIYCEKGLLDFDASMQIKADLSADVIVKKLSGGSGRNIVAGKAYCTLDCVKADAQAIAAKLNELEGIKADAAGNLIEVMSQGKSTHAMSPEKGFNAVSWLMKALGELPCSLSLGDFVQTYNQYVGMDYNGVNIGIGFEDALSGKLTQNIGILKYDEDVLTLECNIRYPASLEKEETLNAIQSAWEKAGFIYKEKSYLPPVYTEPDSPFVKKLMEVYQTATGDTETEAYAIGGATYARGIPNAVAFGPLFPYEEELAHEANECLSIESLEKMTEIYAFALESLLEMK